MSIKTLFRLIAVPVMMLVLTAAFSTTAMAGGGEPTGPSVNLSPPSVALDGKGGIVVTTTLLCWGEAATSGHVTVNVGLGQNAAAGGGTIEVDCIDGAQTLTLPVASVTGAPFHPGPISGMIEFEVVTSSQGGHGIGEIDQFLLPQQAGG